MKSISLFYLVFLSFSVLAGPMIPLANQEDMVYTDKEGKIIEQLSAGITGAPEQKKLDYYSRIISDKKRTYIPTLEKKERFNENFQIRRASNQVLTEYVSPEDVIELTMCKQSPLRVLFGTSLSDKIADIVVEDQAFLEAQVDKETGKSAHIIMKLAIKTDEEVYRTGVKVIRLSDGRSYIIKLNLVKCPSGSIDFVRELILEEYISIKDVSEVKKVMAPEDLITELSNGFDRENQNNVIDIYDGGPIPNSPFMSLSVQIKIGNPTKETMKGKFNFLDALQSRKLESRCEYLKIPSEAYVRRTGQTVLRFNCLVKASKKYALERKYIYMMMVDYTDSYYQYAKIPIKALYEKKKIESSELD